MCIVVLFPVVKGEVECVIEGLKPKQLFCVDGTSAWLLKQCYRHLLTLLMRLINISLETGVFLEQLKAVKLTPVLKKMDLVF